MLYAARPGWPEQDALIPWLHQHARACQVGAQTLRTGALGVKLEVLWQQPALMPVAPSGAEEVAALLAGVCAAR